MGSISFTASKGDFKQASLISIFNVFVFFYIFYKNLKKCIASKKKDLHSLVCVTNNSNKIEQCVPPVPTSEKRRSQSCAEC